MHSLGKVGHNNFSAVQKLADLSVSTQCSDVHEHPAFGFKSCLVQILGNLCWRHPENQNQVSCCSSPAGFIIPYPTVFPYGNGIVLHFYQQQESSTTKTVHKVINKGLKTYV